MNKSARLKALLERGYFPDELPPPFNTHDFARFRGSIGRAWNAIAQYPKSTPEIFGVPKLRGWRRELSIVNPVAQYYVAKIIADNWTELKRHVDKSNYSAEPLEISNKLQRSVPKPDFDLIRLRHAEISANYEYVLISDISRFYGTLYTHAVPWALHGKAWCKANLYAPAYKSSLGNRIDQAVRKGNDNQTIGIPVGPDTSRIVSEIVAAAIDTTIAAKLTLDKTQSVRHVDDTYTGFDSLGEAENGMAVLSAAYRDFQLEMHPEKTRCVHVPREIISPWAAALRNLSFPKDSFEQKKSIEHLFAQAFYFSTDYPSENVINYAVSRSKSIKVTRDNWRLYETNLLKAARSNATTLPAIVQILASYRAMGYNLDLDRIKKLICDLIQKNAPSAFHSEVAWSLFLAKALSIKLSAESLKPVSEIESSVCALLCLDLRARDLIDGDLNVSLWQQSMNQQGLSSSMWLLAYEADLKGWLVPTAPYAHTDPFFSELRKHTVSFYGEQRNVKDIRKSKPRVMSAALRRWVISMSQGRTSNSNLRMIGEIDLSNDMNEY